MVLVALATSCQQAPPAAPVAAVSPTASPTVSALPSPSPTPTLDRLSTIFDALPVVGPAPPTPAITCGSHLNQDDPIALVHLTTGETVLRNYANPSQPQSLCTFIGVSVLALIDHTHVLIGPAAHATFGVFDVTNGGVRWFQLPSTQATLLAVSPDYRQVAWMIAAGDTDEIHLSGGDTKDLLAAAVPNPHAVTTCYPLASKVAAYAGGGAYLFVLDQPSAAMTSLVVFEGRQNVFELVAPAGGWPSASEPTMAYWYGDQLNYKKDGKPWAWFAGARHGEQLFDPYMAPGQIWDFPAVSPTGRYKAFAIRRADGLHDVFVDRFGTSQLSIARPGRTTPVFLADTLLWYRVDSKAGCGRSGSAKIYDVSTTNESSSLVDQVYAIWPPFSPIA